MSDLDQPATGGLPDPEAPARGENAFFGRAGIVRRIIARVGAERPQSVAVIGGRKSGKTSLLLRLADPVTGNAFLDSPARYHLAIPSASGSTGGPAAFIEDIAASLGVRASPSTPYERLRSRVEELHEAGDRVVVLLDDFHHITGNEAFPLEFFSFLRSMANNYNLAYVTTSLLELQALCAAKEIQESPFFNIFTNMHLGMLAPDEATALLCSASGWQATPAAMLASWCGGAPYLLKLAALAARNGKLRPDLDPSRLAAILLPGFSRYFEEVLSALSRDAYHPLLAIAKDKVPQESEVHLMSLLVKQGFLVEVDGRLRPFSPAFATFLRDNLSAKMLKATC